MSAPIRRTFTPPPAELRPWVERFWSWESDCAVPLPLLLPGTGADLFLHYRTPFLAITPDGACLRPTAARPTAEARLGIGVDEEGSDPRSRQSLPACDRDDITRIPAILFRHVAPQEATLRFADA